MNRLKLILDPVAGRIVFRSTPPFPTGIFNASISVFPRLLMYGNQYYERPPKETNSQLY